MSANEVYQKINSLDTTLCDTIWKNLRIIELPDTKESPPAIKSLREDVEEKFKPKSYNIELQLDDENPDKFEESKEQLKKYAPTIETYGLDLRHERRNNDYWGGLLARSITSR